MNTNISYNFIFTRNTKSLLLKFLAHYCGIINDQLPVFRVESHQNIAGVDQILYQHLCHAFPLSLIVLSVWQLKALRALCISGCLVLVQYSNMIVAIELTVHSQSLLVGKH